MATTRKNWHATQKAQLTFGQRVADKVAATMGSWSFIIVQSVILTVWIILNVIAWISRWDPYPFILLNLALSFQAAYAAPFIMISQNRQAERDRHQAEEDFRTNVEAEQRIEELQRQLATNQSQQARQNYRSSGETVAGQISAVANVRSWHKADMLKALTNIAFGGKADIHQRCLPISIYDYNLQACPGLPSRGNFLSGDAPRERELPRAY